MFIDEVKVKFIAGKGGDGVVSWRREKYIPKGGPYGGNGGKGGDVILLATSNINTLSEFRHKKLLKASNGEAGGTQEMAGVGASNLVIKVPVGTLVKDAKTSEIIYDLKEDKEQFILCRGGRGGFGNAHFASSTRQAPAFAELGDIGEEKEVTLELKLVADIGIIGLPNAGKSTLIKTITNVKPKIANYPFTTLIPNLGVMDHKGKSLVIEDVPGLIPGASEGKGLGHSFLKHIERTRVLLHLLDLGGLDEIVNNYNNIRNELKSFSSDLAKKEEIIVFSKADLFDKEMIEFIKKEFKTKTKVKKIFVISAPMNLGIDELKDYLIDKYVINNEKQEEIKTENKMKIYDLKEVSEKFNIKDLGNMEFEVTGERIEQIVRMTDMSNFEAKMRVYDIMDKMGITKKIQSVIKKKYEKEMEYYLFEHEEDKQYLPKIIISGKVFPMDKMFI